MGRGPEAKGRDRGTVLWNSGGYLWSTCNIRMDTPTVEGNAAEMKMPKVAYPTHLQSTVLRETTAPKKGTAPVPPKIIVAYTNGNCTRAL